MLCLLRISLSRIFIFQICCERRHLIGVQKSQPTHIWQFVHIKQVAALGDVTSSGQSRFHDLPCRRDYVSPLPPPPLNWTIPRPPITDIYSAECIISNGNGLRKNLFHQGTADFSSEDSLKQKYITLIELLSLDRIFTDILLALHPEKELHINVTQYDLALTISFFSVQDTRYIALCNAENYR
ncbi:hypothetical protein M422DRAFT_259095 [Sphaerobolus stellatus SS14]|uniref:Uncharacterized protein n=1 Tax=Sphaerobolus stellatus (strain SS14) TaxID=990650 RepID=A0A0C9U5B5_SPHS4|nr:hypothetical protein M422DRAFT_259095 [Sphaerobolus stellatus SS14]